MKVLVDSDFLIAAFRPSEPLHIFAKNALKSYHDQSNMVLVSNLVVQESVTVVSKYVGMDEARTFYTFLPNVVDQTIALDVFVEKEAWTIFLSQTKKGTSFIDCANLAFIKTYNLEGILAFDKFYPKDVRLDGKSGIG